MRWLVKFIMGFVSGAMVGALTALLLAPGSGEQTQSKVKDYASRLSNEVMTAAQEKRTALEEELEKLRHPAA